MELSLPEEFILLALDNKKGRFLIDTLSLNYGLGGAILLELSLHDKFEMENKKLVVKNTSFDKNPVIEQALKIIRKAKKDQKARFWVNKLGRQARRFKKQLTNDLIQKKIIKRERKTFLGIIPYTRFPEVNPKPEAELRKRIYDIILNNKKPDVRSCMLLSLVDNCKLTRKLFPKRADTKMARKKIKELTKEMELAEGISDAIKQVRTAVVAATSAAMVATTAGR